MMPPAIIVLYISILAAQASPPATTTTSVSDVEPNDVLDDAVDSGLTDSGAAIVFDGEIGNNEWGPWDHDLFVFHVSDNAELPRLVTVVMEAVNSNFDGYVSVFDATGRAVGRNDDGAYPNLDPLFSAYLLEPGTYLVGVSSNGGFDPTLERYPVYVRPFEEMPYELVIVLGASPSLSGSLEPSSEEDLAVSVDSMPFQVSNQFIGDGPALWLDVDRFVANVDGPAILTVEVTPTGLHLLDPFVRLTIRDPLSGAGGVLIEPFETKRPDLRGTRLEVAVFEPSAVEIEIRGTLPQLKSGDVLI